MGHELGNASAQYGDLRGTVSMDGPDNDSALYELAGISRDEWFIAAYEIYGSYNSTAAHVWAVPRGDAVYDEWEKVSRGGSRTVPARRFDVQVEDDAAALKLLAQNKRWSIHALYRSLADLGLDVETEE